MTPCLAFAVGGSFDASQNVTGQGDGSYVNVSGDTMTGQLTLSGSTLTVTGPLGVNVTYGVTAGTFTGNGAALTSIAAANISAGSLGGSVIASSITLAAMYGSPTFSTLTVTGNAFSVGGSTFAINSGITYIGGDPGGTDVPLQILRNVSGGAARILLQNSQGNGATDIHYYNSGTGNPANWLIGIPGSDSAFRINNAVNGDFLTINATTGKTDIAGSGFTVGTSTLVVTGGNVGIGTTSPGAKLQIGSEGGGSANGMLLLSGSDATGGSEGGEIRLFTADDYDTTYNYYFMDVYEDDLRIGRVGVSTDWVLKNSGNVGVGTATPGSKLHVVGDATISTSLTVASATVTGSAFSVQVSSTITTATDACGIGTWRWDASYIYICTAANTWKRVAVATWP